MYASSVIEQEQAGLEQKLGFRLTRYDEGYSWDVQADLEQKRQDALAINPAMTDGQVLRGLSRDRQEFIRNERLLSSLDFGYWRRYAWLLPDAAVSDGDLVRFEPWDSQLLILDEMARVEALQYERARRGEPQDGVLIAVPKARQEGISLLAAMVKMHRMCTSPYVLGITATENEDKRTNLYNRDVRLHEHLPWYLKPERTAPDLQAVRLTFGKLDSSMSYQDYMQEGSLGAGEQFLVGHMSELAQGNQLYVEKMLTLDYFPAIPQSWRSCHLLESTPAGMGGYWHPFVMDEVLGKGRWRVKFVPWYALRFKYSRVAPSEWTPAQATLEHARKVEETSAGYMGRTVVLAREQLYWWETTREEYRKKGNLAYFLTNYPATLEESFQSYNTSIFSFEDIEYYRTQTRQPGGVYEMVTR